MSFPAYPDYKESGVAWLGDIPAGWSVARFRHVFRESSEKIEDEVVGPMLSVSGYRGIEIKEYDDENRRRLDEDLVGYRIVRPDQLVVNTMWLNYAGLGVSQHEGHVSPAYRSYWIEGSLDRRYIHHLMRSSIYVQGYTRLLTGIRPNSLQMSRDDLMDFPVVLPAIEEQAAIATFLDRETAKIDALVAEQERLIALLREKRQAVISHAVTKGLNPDAPMKDSGIEWLGEIPAHWEILPLTRVVRQFVDYRGATPNKVDEGVPLLTAATIKEGVIDHSRDPVFISEAEYETRMTRGFPAKGDLLLTTEAPLGESALIEDEHVAPGQRMILMKMEPAYMLSSYLLAHFHSQFGQAELWTRASGSTASGIRADRLRASLVAVPPLDEQQAIAEYIVEQTKSFGAIDVEANTAINLLQERRAALISAAVTGKIDVRAQAPQSNVISIDSARPSNLPPLRAIVGAYAIRELGPMGRMAVMKAGYLAEGHVGFGDLNGRYERYAAGPYDQNLIAAMERGAGEICAIVTNEPQDEGKPVTYDVPKGCQPPSDALLALVGQDPAQRFLVLLSLLKGIGRDGVEAAATLYAVWNDLLAAGKAADDDAICNGVLNDWHPEKAKKFKRADLDHWLDWMRRNRLVPDGSAPRTDNQGNLFA